QESMEKLASMKYIRDYSIDFTTFPENILNQALADKKIKFTDNWPSSIMYRLYFDQIFPHLDSILYLDADIVVLRDLNSLTYKNSGVVFLNLKNMLLETLQNSKCDFSFPDQDLLNVAFQHYIYPLSMRWNFFIYFETQSPYFSYFILHYAGPKPWTTEDKITKYYWRY
ncbi:glycosyltransferase, partial [Rickettsia conorii]|uniref:glycosyltransferase n=1 Tax=Rickettsia conorii TaxID=781 RepID=UPI003AF0912F